LNERDAIKTVTPEAYNCQINDSLAEAVFPSERETAKTVTWETKNCRINDSFTRSVLLDHG